MCSVASETRSSVFAHAAAALTSFAAGASCNRAGSCAKRTASRHSFIAAARRLMRSMGHACLTGFVAYNASIRRVNVT